MEKTKISEVKSRADANVREAVRSLRNRLKETQQQFATRLGTAISSVVRYELSRPPKGNILAKLARLAMENGFNEEASVFLNSFYAEMGFVAGDLEKIDGGSSAINLPKIPAREPPEYTVRTEREIEVVRDFLWSIQCSTNRWDSLSIMESDLKTCRADRQSYEAELETALAQLLVISEMKALGQRTEAVTAQLSIPTVKVQLWVDLSREIFHRLRDGESKEGKLRQLFFELATGEYDVMLADYFLVPVSVVQTLKKERETLGIPIPRRHGIMRLAEEKL